LKTTEPKESNSVKIGEDTQCIPIYKPRSMLLCWTKVLGSRCVLKASCAVSANQFQCLQVMWTTMNNVYTRKPKLLQTRSKRKISTNTKISTKFLIDSYNTFFK